MKIDTSTQKILESLTTTATETLYKKQQLGQYAVVWQDNRILIVDNNDASAEKLVGLDHTPSLALRRRD